MYCRNCGKEIAKGANFCRYCGMRSGQNIGQPESFRVCEHSPGSRIRIPVVAVCMFLILAAVVGAGYVYFGTDMFRSMEERTLSDADEMQQADGTEKHIGGDRQETIEEKMPEEPPEEETENIPDGEEETVQYILPESHMKYLTMEELEGLTAEECRIARNELYARHGRKFTDEALQDYFDSCDWYEGTVEADDFDDSVMNEYETANRDLIVQYEEEQGYRQR